MYWACNNVTMYPESHQSIHDRWRNTHLYVNMNTYTDTYSWYIAYVYMQFIGKRRHPLVQLTHLRAQVGSSRGGFVRGIEVRKLEASLRWGAKETLWCILKKTLTQNANAESKKRNVL